jgi:hypothetical protein
MRRVVPRAVGISPRRALIPVLALMPLAMVGCNVVGPRLHKNIVQVSRFYNKQNPWVNFDKPPRRVPGGVKVTVYLSTPDRDVGVFGDGSINFDLYRIDRIPGQPPVQTHLHRWNYPPEKAARYRAPESRLGRGYRVVLNWGDIDVFEEEIMIQVTFERVDGQILQGRPMYFHVPRTF